MIEREGFSMRNVMIALAMGTSVFATGAQAKEPTKVYDATITRTEFNIPHIRSDSWQGVGYGVAYAYAQDNVCMLAEEFATVAGERSRFFGPDGRLTLGFRETDNLTSDVFYRSQIDLAKLNAGLSDQGDAARQLVDGYVAGYNRYLRDTGVSNLPEACRDKPWVRPITRDDMLRLNEKQMLLASSLAVAPGIASAAPPESKVVNTGETAMLAPGRIVPGPDDAQYGSNGWAFGKDVTANGRGLVIGNPHFPWEGPARFWQLHVTGPDGYDVMGVGIAGTPIPTLGFNKDIAWTHTVTAARHFTAYALTLSPEDPTTYMVDGKPMKMESREVTVPMPDGMQPVTRTLYSTQFGPVMTLEGTPFGWSDTNAYAIRDANSGNQSGLDTWLAIGKAKSVSEIETAVTATLGIPWVNTIAADRDGNALHADITRVPNTSTEFIKGCSTPFTGLVAGQVTLLDGTRSECDWRNQDNVLLPADQQASRIRTDYLTNSNDSYWISNPRDPYRALSPILGEHEKPLSLRTRSNFTETEGLIADTKVDSAAAKSLVFGNKSLAADLVVEPLLEGCKRLVDTDLAPACAALEKWDRKFNLDSRGTYLFVKYWDKARANQTLWEVPFDKADPVNTPRGFLRDDAAMGRQLANLSEAADQLSEEGIALDAPWGEVQVRMDGEDAIAIHGGPGEAGVLNMQRSRPIKGAITPVHGSSYIQIVTFDDDGPVAEAILSYSQSTDPASPHYADQTRLYSGKRWHRLPFHADEIAAEQTGEALHLSE
jgi:acyl-homoserine-lactone acylase